jgi:hypothetical protein
MLFVDRLRGIKRDLIAENPQTDARRQMVAARLPDRLFGTPEFAVPTLEALMASRHPVVGAVTQPDRPRGRGHKTTAAPIKARAAAANLPILQPERLKDPGLLDALAAFRADLGVVAAYGKILTDAVLATPRLGMINVHASLLPKYRGAAPVHRAIIAGEIETGVTIMRVVKALDAGPMLATTRRPIDPTRPARTSNAICAPGRDAARRRGGRSGRQPCHGDRAGRRPGDLRAPVEERGRRDRLESAG